MHILKSWSILTSDIHFYNEFRLRCCLKNHTHEWIQGTLTPKSAYYPMQLCNSIARCWQKRFLPDRWLKMLWVAPVTGVDPFQTLFAAEEVDENEDSPFGLADDEAEPEDFEQAPRAAPPQPLQPVAVDENNLKWDTGEDVSLDEVKKWKVKLVRFHKAAGHPSARNLARMLADAQVDKWKVRLALQFKCDTCEELRPGGQSSKQIPPAAMKELPEAWEHVGVDVGEWTVPNQDIKVKFILMIDMATRYRVTEPLFVYKHGEVKIENTEDVIKIFVMRWLMDKPRPRVIIPDNAKSLSSQKLMDFLGELCIAVVPPPAQESWSHGIVEHAIGHVKETASLIQHGQPDQEPTLTLALATAAINSTEYTKGFTSIQWAFGRQSELGEEEFRQQISAPLDRQQHAFLRLMNQRQSAEEAARRGKARVVMGKLANSSLPQPVRSFSL